MVDFRVSVVLPAAGCGSRMECDVPKQYLKILDRPLISYTIQAFECISWIENIVVVGPMDEKQKQILENIVLEFNHKKVITTCGESTRHRSIFNGVRCFMTRDSKPDVILIHDAVRPFIAETLLQKIAIAAHKHGACGVVRPLVSTVLARNEDGFLDHALDRSKFVASEMPQAFQYDVILNAYEKCTQNDFEFGTECLHLAFKYSNARAYLIDGPDYLWKVTYKKDMFAAEGIIKERLRRRAKFSGHKKNGEFENAVKKQFEEKGVEVQINEELELDKVNILVNFSLLQQYRSTDADSKSGLRTDWRSDMIEHLERIERNGILVIVDIGAQQDELVETRRMVENISRRSSEQQITCCGVWCEWLYSKTLEKLPHDQIVHLSNMIVSVALETSQTLNGQVFTVLDTE